MAPEDCTSYISNMRPSRVVAPAESLSAFSALASRPMPPAPPERAVSGSHSSSTMTFLRRRCDWKRQRGWVWSDENWR